MLEIFYVAWLHCVLDAALRVMLYADAMPCSELCFHAVLCCATTWCAMWCWVILCCVVLFSCCAMLCFSVLVVFCCAGLGANANDCADAIPESVLAYVVLGHAGAVLFCVLLCHDVWRCAVLCRAKCYAVLCCAVPCCAVLCCAVLCCAWGPHMQIHVGSRGSLTSKGCCKMHLFPLCSGASPPREPSNCDTSLQRCERPNVSATEVDISYSPLFRAKADYNLSARW